MFYHRKSFEKIRRMKTFQKTLLFCAFVVFGVKKQQLNLSRTLDKNVLYYIMFQKIKYLRSVEN